MAIAFDFFATNLRAEPRLIPTTKAQNSSPNSARRNQPPTAGLVADVHGWA
jgi:hypothetical protein